MRIKHQGILGLITSGAFLTGVASLLIYNPQLTNKLLENRILMTLNVVGMSGQLWAAYVIYLTAGLSVIVFGVGLLRVSSNTPMILVGKVLLIASGIIWLSFGLSPLDPQPNQEVTPEIKSLAVGALLFADVICPIALLIVGAEIHKISRDKVLEFYTIATGLSIWIFQIAGGMFGTQQGTTVTMNIAITSYFLWFGFFGLRLITRENSLKKSKQN